MPQNQIVPFAAGDGANTLTYSAYFNKPYVAQGFQPGVASSAAVNTALRQASTVAAGLAQFVADNQTTDVLDDGIPANFEAKLTAALKGLQSASSVHYGVATGSGDAMVVAAIPPLVATAGGGYQAGSFLVVKTPATANTTTAPTINANALGNIDITKASGSAVAKGDLAAATWTVLFFDGVGCDYVGQAQSDVLAIVLANITAAQIFNITQQAPPGSGLAATLARLDFMPTGADSSILSATFTAPSAGTVQASSILISSPQNGFSNAVEIDVNGAPVAQNADSIAGLIINVAAATVSKGDTVTVKGTVSSSQAAIYNTTQRFTYSFIPS